MIVKIENLNPLRGNLNQIPCQDPVFSESEVVQSSFSTIKDQLLGIF